jgi:undecaprenyl-diphosphatase
MRCVATRVGMALRQAVLRPRGAMPPPSRQFVATGIAGFLALFAVVMVLFDAPAILAARGLPTALVAAFRAVTGFGRAGLFLYPLGALMAILLLAPRGLPRTARGTLASVFARAGFLFFAIGIPFWFNTTIKQVIGRARPFVGGSANPYLYHPFSWGPEYASLPSNHAATVCAAAVAIGALWPRARIVMWLYAAVIMISRIVIVAHHPSDVLAGAAVGVCGALLVRNYFAARRLVFGVTPQGAVTAFAGPSWRRIVAAIRALMPPR